MGWLQVTRKVEIEQIIFIAVPFWPESMLGYPKLVPKFVVKISNQVPQMGGSEHWGPSYFLARVLWARSPCPPVVLLAIFPTGIRVFGMFRQASDREAVYACFTFSHWLVYANSAANPIIYNFLSGKWTMHAVAQGGHGPLVHLRLVREDVPARLLSLWVSSTQGKLEYTALARGPNLGP